MHNAIANQNPSFQFDLWHIAMAAIWSTFIMSNREIGNYSRFRFKETILRVSAVTISNYFLIDKHQLIGAMYVLCKLVY